MAHHCADRIVVEEMRIDGRRIAAQAYAQFLRMHGRGSAEGDGAQQAAPQASAGSHRFVSMGFTVIDTPTRLFPNAPRQQVRHRVGLIAIAGSTAIEAAKLPTGSSLDL
jgi:hypothetical protein